MTESNSTAVTIPPKMNKDVFRSTVDSWTAELARLAPRGFNISSLMAGASQAVVNEPSLAECDGRSVYLALAKCARLGLDIGEGGMYLVALNKKIKSPNGEFVTVKSCEAWPSYLALKLLAARARIIRTMEEYVVYEGDVFDSELGLTPFLKHKPGPASKRGRILGAYSIIGRVHQSPTFHFMAIEDIEARRASSRSWGPKFHPTCPDWYAKKTVVRDYLSRQPKSAELEQALEQDDVEDVEPRDETAVEQEQRDEAQSSDAATEKQKAFLISLMKSHVWSAVEREKTIERVTTATKRSAADMISRAQAEIARREAQEKETVVETPEIEPGDAAE